MLIPTSTLPGKAMAIERSRVVGAYADAGPPYELAPPACAQETRDRVAPRFVAGSDAVGKWYVDIRDIRRKRQGANHGELAVEAVEEK